jgi:chromosomal replication initiation ATPase DnaA
MKKLTRRTVCAGLAAVPAAMLLQDTAAAGKVVETLGPAIEPDVMQGDLIDRIIAVVARHDGVTADLMRSGERTWIAVNARRKVMYLSYRMSRTSLPEIGRRLGGRDPVTVLFAVRVLDQKVRADRTFAAELEHLASQADARAKALFAASAERLRRVAA